MKTFTAIRTHPASRAPVNRILHRCPGSSCSAGARDRSYTKQNEAPQTVGQDSIVHSVLQSPGQQLDPATRAHFEPLLGYDFSHVRVHSDAQAATSARAVNALAYTVGHDIVFGAGQYTPYTPDGRKLIAHELAHVVQQGNESRPAARPADGVRLSDPGDSCEREAEALSVKLAEGQFVTATSRTAGLRAIAPVQRQTSPTLTSPPQASPTATPPSVSVPPTPVRTVKVWVHSFIPMASVKDPFGYCYSGDNRSFSNSVHASYRTHQEIEFDVTAEASTINWSDTGTTHELDRATCTKVIASAKAPTTRLVNRIVSSTGSLFNLSFVGTATNPRASYACAIDLNLSILIDVSARKCTVSGQHDGFPAYEIYVTANGGAGVPVYMYDPVAAGEGATALCGGMDKTAAGTASF